MLPGQAGWVVPERGAERTEHVLRRQGALQRVLGFTGRTIDDVVNSPVVRREVLGYFKLHRWVERQCEVVELERQWNPLRGTVTTSAWAGRPGGVMGWAARPGRTRVRRGAV